MSSNTLKSHVLGYPRIGADRELKRALESFWKGAITESDLSGVAEELKQKNRQTQKDAGVYDIHSPRVPTREEIVELLKKALNDVPKERLWVNPDCGLKTRDWPEVMESLKNMVAAAKELRKEL